MRLSIRIKIFNLNYSMNLNMSTLSRISRAQNKIKNYIKRVQMVHLNRKFLFSEKRLSAVRYHGNIIIEYLNLSCVREEY